MTRLFPRLFLLAGFCATAALTQEKSSDPRLFVSNVNIINPETGKKLPLRTVVVSAGRISEVKDNKEVKPPTGAKTVDGTGKYLIPVLWDMHVHAMYASRLDRWMPLFVANGVLGVRDMGSPMKLADVKRLREEIAAGSRPRDPPTAD